jgi:3-phosphoinositide dependent protein kinase-1
MFLNSSHFLFVKTVISKEPDLKNDGSTGNLNGGTLSSVVFRKLPNAQSSVTVVESKDPPLSSSESSGVFRRRKSTPKENDFLFGTMLGEGAYAQVAHVRLKNADDEFAMKIMNKRFISKENKVKFVMQEKNVLTRLHREGGHPAVIKLFYTFQNSAHLFMAMELCHGGELLHMICSERQKRLESGVKDMACDFKTSQFYISEIVVGMEYLHDRGIVHRDLKPENILFTSKGHIKITDFGTAKDNTGPDKDDNSFCGTAEYVSPEVLKDQEATTAADLWALGVMVFQIFIGRPPFRGASEYLTFDLILKFPEEFQYPTSLPHVAKSLFDALVRQEPTERLGWGPSPQGYAALKSHEFFTGIDFANLFTQNAPHKPELLELQPIKASSSDWLSSGLPTELEVGSSMHGSEVMYSVNDSFNTPLLSSYATFLEPHEAVMFDGSVLVDSGLVSLKRRLVLTNRRRLLLVEPDKMAIICNIALGNIKRVAINRKRKLLLIDTEIESFRFMKPQRTAERWGNALSRVFSCPVEEIKDDETICSCCII